MKEVSLPCAVMKTAAGGCKGNTVKLLYAHNFAEEMEQFLRSRWDMPTTVVQRYCKAKGAFNHVIRVRWRREGPIEKFLIRNKMPMSQGAFFAKVSQPDKSKAAIAAAKAKAAAAQA